MPIMIPIRHMRPHIGFTWFLSTSASLVFSAGSDVALTVAKLMDMINMTSLGLVVAYGLIWQEHLSQFSLVPSDLRENAPNVWTAATVVAQQVLLLTKFDGI